MNHLYGTGQWQSSFHIATAQLTHRQGKTTANALATAQKAVCHCFAHLLLLFISVFTCFIVSLYYCNQILFLYFYLLHMLL